MNSSHGITETPLNFNPGSSSHGEDQEAFAWTEPVFFGEVPTDPIYADALPGWLGQFVKSVSDSTQTPEGMAVMMALAVMATCLQRKIEISPGGDYVEPVSIWTVTALPPASRKTAVKTALTSALRRWEKDQAIKLQPEIDKVESERKISQDRIKELETKAAKAENEESRAAIVEEVGKLKHSIREHAELRAPQLSTSDVTPEQLQNLLMEHGERMAVLSDEGGIFEIMTGLYSDGKVNIDVFLQGHAGSPVRVNRAQRTVVLDKPALTFGLCVQPEVIAELNQGSKRRLRGSGALARFLYCLPESNVGSRDVRKSMPVDPALAAQFETNVRLWLNIEGDTLQNGEYQPKRLTLSAEALDYWLTFSQHIENNQGPGREYESFQDWTGKLPGAALRIAALCHVAEFGSVGVVNAATMERSLNLCTKLISHARAAFDLMATDAAIADAKFILQWILAEGADKFLKNNLHRLGRFSKSKVDRLNKALEILADRGIISKQQSFGPGKPTQYFWVNPKLVVKNV
jgi:hypothetical protein